MALLFMGAVNVVQVSVQIISFNSPVDHLTIYEYKLYILFMVKHEYRNIDLKVRQSIVYPKRPSDLFPAPLYTRSIRSMAVRLSSQQQAEIFACN